MSRQRRIRIVPFTLMEMVVVITIIALLAGVGVPMYFSHLEKANKNTAKMQVKLLEQAVFDYKLDTKKLPTKLDDLIATPGGEKWNGPYLKGKKIPMDPWGNPYVYNLKGDGEFEIISYGADGQPGGTGKNEDLSSED